MQIEKLKTEQLIPADYNPRKDLKPGDPEYEKLKRSIEQFGYVEPVIWNKTTGNIVGGHQRLKVLLDMGITEALRQSPDYIVIGEIRNLFALKAAITAAEAGHGILGTIHSFGAARTMTRMLSMFPDSEKEFVRYQLSSNLNFILSQQLKFEEKETILDFELMINVPAMENTIRDGRFNQIDNLILLGEKQGMKRFGG